MTPAGRVLADASVDHEALVAVLAGTGVTVAPLDGVPAGDDVVGVVAWERRMGEAELAALPGLRVVLTPSVGFDHIDLDAARRHGGAGSATCRTTASRRWPTARSRSPSR